MKVTVKLFAIVRDRAGVSDVALDLPDESTIATAAEALALQFPAIENFLPRCAFALNLEYTSISEPLKDGDELAVIPPVSGG
jgi:molybdopterin converting factor subunit 1